MTQENHEKLNRLNPEVKEAYISAKTRILETIAKMDLFEKSSLSQEDRDTIIELLNDTSFLMKSEKLT